jgi:hypothetical protein
MVIIKNPRSILDETFKTDPSQSNLSILDTMAYRTKTISINLLDKLVQLSVPFDDDSLKRINHILPQNNWNDIKPIYVSIIDAFILFEKIIQNTEFLQAKRDRFVGHLCGYGYGTYDELSSALLEHRLC